MFCTATEEWNNLTDVLKEMYIRLYEQLKLHYELSKNTKKKAEVI